MRITKEQLKWLIREEFRLPPPKGNKPWLITMIVCGNCGWKGYAQEPDGSGFKVDWPKEMPEGSGHLIGVVHLPNPSQCPKCGGEGEDSEPSLPTSSKKDRHGLHLVKEDDNVFPIFGKGSPPSSSSPSWAEEEAADEDWMLKNDADMVQLRDWMENLYKMLKDMEKNKQRAGSGHIDYNPNYGTREKPVYGSTISGSAETFIRAAMKALKTELSRMKSKIAAEKQQKKQQLKRAEVNQKFPRRTEPHND